MSLNIFEIFELSPPHKLSVPGCRLAVTFPAFLDSVIMLAMSDLWYASGLQISLLHAVPQWDKKSALAYPEKFVTWYEPGIMYGPLSSAMVCSFVK